MIKIRNRIRTPLLVAIALALSAFTALSNGSTPVNHPSTIQQLTKSPRIQIDATRGMASMEFSVMTYNVAGLPWPIRRGRPEALKEISRDMVALHAADRAPDVVVLQEAFTRESEAVGAPFVHKVSGPGAKAVTGFDLQSLSS